MTRLLILLTHPHHLHREDAATWIHTEATRLVALDGVAGVHLTLLRGASDLSAREWDWMLELFLDDLADPCDCAGQPGCVELVGDLRLLGMRPVVLVADGDTPLSAAERT